MDDFIQGAIRIVLALLEPIGLIWLALLLLTALLWRKRQHSFAFATGALAAAIYVIGATDVPGALLRSLERPYAGVNYATLPNADAVVLLGGGVGPSRNEVAGLHLSEAGDRVVMALEMMRLGKAPVLVCGGGIVKMEGRELHEADLLKRALEERVSIPEVISLGGCHDTHEEAMRTLNLVRDRGWQRLLLVSSASHLPRAVATFRTLGLTVIPVPCDFRTTLSTAPTKVKVAMPGYEGFEKTSVWMHETIGWWEYRRRGWIDPVRLAP
ncbi:MAG TPA: YdcF family protein [Chthoniobacteraceae bacterium]|nr:YdcF family protein [Chthoniobacteraceae bacterium]